MDEILEIRHSSKEKKRQMIAFFILFSMNPLEELLLRNKGFEKHLPFQIVLALLFTISTWVLINRQYICIDSRGINYRRWFTAHKVSWAEIETYSANWETAMDDFLFTSYGFFNLKGKITLKIRKKSKPIKLKIDFGSSEQRSEARTMIMTQLRNLATP